MAEIMILIIFLLLLSLSMLAKDVDDRLAAAESQRDQARSQLQQVRMQLSLPLSSTDSQDDLFAELRLMKDAAGRESRLGSDIAAARMLVDQARLSFALSGNASEEVSGLLGKLAKTVEKFPTPAPAPEPASGGSGGGVAPIQQFSDTMEALGSWVETKRKTEGTDPGTPVATLLGQAFSCDRDYRALLASVKTDGGLDAAGAIADARADANNARGQVKNLELRLEDCTGGVGPPPCWAVAETGKAEYIFDAALRADGIVLKDNALPHRRREQERLPIQDIEFGRTYSEPQFLAATLPLLSWAQENECIFYVRVFDEIDNRKDVYKQKLRTLEARFYKYEIRDSKFAAGKPAAVEAPSFDP